MSFFRHEEIYRPMGSSGSVPGRPPKDRRRPHRLDEFPAGYSLAGCAPAVNDQTVGLDKTGRNRAELQPVLLSERERRQAIGRGLTGALQSPTRSVVPGPLHAQASCSRKHHLDGRMVTEPCLPQRMKVAAGSRLQGCRCEDMIEPAAYEGSLALQVPAEFLRFVAECSFWERGERSVEEDGRWAEVSKSEGRHQRSTQRSREDSQGDRPDPGVGCGRVPGQPTSASPRRTGFCKLCSQGAQGSRSFLESITSSQSGQRARGGKLPRRIAGELGCPGYQGPAKNGVLSPVWGID